MAKVWKSKTTVAGTVVARGWSEGIEVTVQGYEEMWG